MRPCTDPYENARYVITDCGVNFTSNSDKSMGLSCSMEIATPVMDPNCVDTFFANTQLPPNTSAIDVTVRMDSYGNERYHAEEYEKMFERANENIHLYVNSAEYKWYALLGSDVMQHNTILQHDFPDNYSSYMVGLPTHHNTWMPTPRAGLNVSCTLQFLRNDKISKKYINKQYSKVYRTAVFK